MTGPGKFELVVRLHEHDDLEPLTFLRQAMLEQRVLTRKELTRYGHELPPGTGVLIVDYSIELQPHLILATFKAVEVVVSVNIAVIRV
jgi:hypothetical protein